MRITNSILIIITGLFFNACALEQASPSDYNDAIYIEQMKVKQLLTNLSQSTDPDRQSEIVAELKIQSQKSLDRINEIGPFRDDKQLFEASVVLFEFYKNIANEGLDVDKTKISTNLELLRTMISEQEHMFFKAQGKFAEEYELFL